MKSLNVVPSYILSTNSHVVMLAKVRKLNYCYAFVKALSFHVFYVD